LVVRALFVAGMATQRKRRTLRLADGGVFHIGPGTVSVPVSTIPLDPPAVVLHINRSCGALELEPDNDGTTPPPVRVDPARALQLVEQINADRAMCALRGGRAEPPVELPPTFKGTARHVAAWQQQRFPFAVSDEAAGYPGKLPETSHETLWVKRANGACLLERVGPNAPHDKVANVEWADITPARAVEWLTANGYRAIPATLHRLARNGGTNERPRRTRKR
jgi:hypothetical protein